MVGVVAAIVDVGAFRQAVAVNAILIIRIIDKQIFRVFIYYSWLEFARIDKLTLQMQEFNSSLENPGYMTSADV